MCEYFGNLLNPLCCVIGFVGTLVGRLLLGLSFCICSLVAATCILGSFLLLSGIIECGHEVRFLV